MKVEMYNIKGKSAGKADVADSVFATSVNPTLIHQVVVSMQSNARQGSAHTKDRSEVSGTGKKPWRQKGSGRARHGSRRSPIWRTGGVTFGPRNEQNFAKKINKKMKVAALYGALSGKLADAHVLFVDDLGLGDGASTKAANTALEGLTAVSGFETLTHANPSNVCVVVPTATAEMVRSIRNLGYANVTDALNINALDVVNNRYLVVVDPVKSSEVLASRHHSQKTVSESTEPKASSKPKATKKVTAEKSA